MKTLNDLIAKKKNIEEEIQFEKENLNFELRIKYKTLFKTMDILLILMLLFNIGAALITNAMVIKKEPKVKFYELNPIISQKENYKNIAEVKGIQIRNSIIVSILFSIFLYSIIIIGYLYNKYEVYSKWRVYRFFAIYLFGFMVLILDFINDLGYFIGKIIWGN